MKNSKLGSNEHPALHRLSKPQNELLAVRHPAPKKLISLRRHKVSEATIEHLGFVGNPLTRGTLSALGTACWRVWRKLGDRVDRVRRISRESLQNGIGTWEVHDLLAQWQSYDIISHKQRTSYLNMALETWNDMYIPQSKSCPCGIVMDIAILLCEYPQY